MSTAATNITNAHTPSPASILADGDHLPGMLGHHFEDLTVRRPLKKLTVSSNCICSVTSPEQAAIMLGHQKPWRGLVPAIAIPFTGPNGQPDYWRLRPDTPRKIKGKPAKYESPKGQPNRAYIPKGVAEHQNKSQVDIAITEGELKALAITQEIMPCIGITGVWNWKHKKHEKLTAELEAWNWKGRRVYIVYDSDLEHKADVQLAESRLAKMLIDRGAIVKCVRLPDGPMGNDGEPTKMGADDFLIAHGSVALCKLFGEAIDPEPLTGADSKEHANSIEPAEAAKVFLAEKTFDGMPKLIFWRGCFHIWMGGRYVEIEPSEAQADLILYLNRGHVFLTSSIVGNVNQQVKAQAALPSRIEPPAWIGERKFTWLPNEVLATKRKIVHIPSVFAGGSVYEIPATPRYFIQSALDYDFTIDAPEPVLWLAFLRQLWPDDEDSIATLQQWCGYVLSCDTSQQKILMLIGPPRSGKGTICRVLGRLVGGDNICAPTLASFEQNFGLQPLLGKSLAIISDARLGGKSDQNKVVERLLSISGEDSLTVDRKHREAVTGKIMARLMIVSNELPKLAESSGALSHRMIVLQLSETFLDREDTGLTEKLWGELPSILLWSLAGWRRLQAQGRFVQPESGKELAAEMKDLCSPIGLFVRQRCKVGKQYEAEVDDVFAAWCDWCKENGRDHHGTKQTFGRDLRAAVGVLKVSQATDNGDRVRVYEGIKLT